jgi:peptide-N4-(N-acetyl-beta-glucosaminyl)asparagine amidase
MNRQHQPPLLPTSEEEQLARSLAHTASKVIDCERLDVQSAWRSALQPLLERLEREEKESDDDQAAIARALFGGGSATAAPPPPPQPNAAEEDRLIRRLLRLFKHEGFFSWVDSPPCPSCCCSSTAAAATTPTTTAFARSDTPTPAEQSDDPTISRVEVHTCRVCGTEARFPRHASALKLLQTRKGRCGEWAHAFLAALRSQGVEARHCQDREDHVWTEYWRSSEQRWVHLDCCEGACDAPHLYERGWGKKLTFAFAVGRSGAADVSLRYAGVAAATGAEAQARALQERRQGCGVREEAWLRPCLERLSRWLRWRQQRRRQQEGPTGAVDAAERRRREAADALDLVLRSWGLVGGGGGNDADGAASLGGRTSGSAAWRAARGEDGTGGEAAAAASTAPPSSSTPWAWAREAPALRDSPQLAAFSAACGRLNGGAARASADNAAAGETAAAALEGRMGGSGKWLAFLPFPPQEADADASASANDGNRGHWLEYRLPLPSPFGPVALVSLRSYDLVSANDAPERDPCDWALERWCEEEGRWVVADARSGERFSRRHQLRSFFLPEEDDDGAAPAKARAWRLRVTRVSDGAAANSVQLGGWSLYGSPAAEKEEAGAELEEPSPEAAADAARALRALLASSSSSSVSIPGARALRLAADPAARAALAAAGFRPWLLQGGEAALVADASADGARKRAEAALQALGVSEF